MAIIWEKNDKGGYDTSRTGIDAAYFKFGSFLEKIKSGVGRGIKKATQPFVDADKRQQKAYKESMQKFIEKSKDPSQYGRNLY